MQPPEHNPLQGHEILPPPPEVQLSVHEIVEVKGGRFRVQSLGKKAIVLHALPGTSVDVCPIDDWRKEVANWKLRAQEIYQERLKLCGLVYGLLKEKFALSKSDVGPSYYEAVLDFEKATQIPDNHHLEVKPAKDKTTLTVRLVIQGE